MQIVIELPVLADLMKTAKLFVAKERDPYNNILCHTEDNTITINACDGFKAVSATYPLVNGAGYETFTLPVFDPPKGKGVAVITIESCDITAKYDGHQVHFTRPAPITMGWKDFVPKTETDYTIWFNAKMLSETLKDFGKNAVKLEFHGKHNGLVIVGKDGKKALILPVRGDE